MEQQVLDRPEGEPSSTPLGNRDRARTAMIIGSVVALLLVADIVSYTMQAGLLRRIGEGSYTAEEATRNDLRVYVIAIAEILSRIVFIVFFIMWFRRAYHNLEKLGVNIRYAEGWAAGAWFVPFLNLVRPFQIMSEIWREYILLVGPEKDKGVRSEAILWLWWIGYLLGSIVTNLGTRMVEGTIPKMIMGTKVIIIGGVLHLSSILLLIWIIRTISHRENRVIMADTTAQGN